jgi:acetyl esterase/lipase
MDKRTFLKTMAAVGAVGAPGVSLGKAGYDPNARFALRVSEVEYRRNAKGRPLLARIYQPQGKGPFPILLDLHGGAWSAKDRYANEPMARGVAVSVVFVESVVLLLACVAPYPAWVLDAHYASRWL